MKSHLNLKRMVIDFHEFANPLDDYDIDDYLLCVPNLEQLCVYRENEDANIIPYIGYNWLARSIERHLLSLRRFKYYFRIYSAEELIEDDNENILNSLEESFKHVHNNRYQFKLVFNLYYWSIFD